MFPKLARLSVVCALALFLSSAGFAAVFDPYTAFSSSNPSGPWTFGYTVSLNSAFIPFTEHYAAPDLGAFTHDQAWRESAVDQYLGLYQTSSPGVLLSHPGALGQFAVLRFTAPASGPYTVSSTFSGYDAATTDVYVYANGSQLFASVVSGLGASVDFNQIVTLAPSQFLDIVVGYGSNGNSNDATGLQLLVSNTVPEPGSALLLVTGLALLVGARRKFGFHKR